MKILYRFYRLSILAFSLTLLFFALSLSFSQDRFGIVAVVNDDAITGGDVINRQRLLFLNSGIESNDENQERLHRLSIRQLIDDSLKLQEAENLGLLAGDRDVDTVVANLEKLNKLPLGGLLNLLKRNNIDEEHFRLQILARLSWGNVLQREFNSIGGIGEDEIATYIDTVKSRQAKKEVHLREIFLPFPSRSLIERTRTLAQNILRRIEGGADFAALALNFSESHSARLGGDSGWIPLELVDPKIATAIANLSDGETSQPIESISGITIVKLEKSRTLTSQQIAQITNKEKAQEYLKEKKLELLNRQKLHNIKSNAFIELR